MTEGVKLARRILVAARPLIFLLASIAWASPVVAAPFSIKDVPQPLRSWVPWVLDGDKARVCPFLHAGKRYRCLWPTRLELALTKSGGTFKQGWFVHQRHLAPLPGDRKRWPQDVRVDSKPVPVVEQAGAPEVMLEPGPHTIEGRFVWERLPDALSVPGATGLVALSLEGAAMPFPRRDAQGRVLLSSSHRRVDQKQRLEIVVHRMITDEIPITVKTRIKLEVAGASREVVLAQATLDNFVPLSLRSKLPARLEPDGRLRVQVRPGPWIIEVDARQRQKSDALVLPRAKPGASWVKEEVWVFVPRTALRLVEVTGVVGVDPQQTTLPKAWRRYSTYRVRPGQTMALQQRRRGEAAAAPDQLELRRVAWLDFSGDGLTFADRISGTLRRSSRLEMSAEVGLGRVTAGGRDQFITRRGALIGVELRRGSVSARADSRYQGDVSNIPAVGWNHDVQKLSTTLHLPPGWRLFNVSGVDRAPGTWVEEWTLLDMFLVLIIGLAVAKLFGWQVGALALLTLVLTFTEGDAPRYIWPFALALEALRRALPAGWLQKVTTAIFACVGLALLLISVPFIVGQVRQGIYPALEHRYRSLDSGRHGDGAVPSWLRRKKATRKQVQKVRAVAGAAINKNTINQKNNVSGLYGLSGPVSQSLSRHDQRQLDEYDPNAVVQTGPGVPSWRWNVVSLIWSGPVRKSERVGLTLLSPAVNLALGIVRALLLFALLLLLLVIGRRRRALIDRRPRRESPRAPEPAPASSVTLVLGVILVAALGADARAQTPPPAMLDALKTRLTRPPSCFPSCATSSRLSLEVKGGVLRARMQVDALVLTAVPLPGQERHFRAEQVWVDGRPARGLAREGGELWVWLSPGRHQLLLQGRLPPRSTVQLLLPLKPHRVETDLQGWRVEGIAENGVPDDTLILSRRETTTAKALQPGELPPFVRITRRLVLGLAWQVETTAVRLSPKGSPIVLAVPLLAGESVTSEKVRVKGGKAQLQLAPDQRLASWRSVLKRSDVITLKAPEGVQWSEVWQVASSPIWHVEASGLPRIHQQAKPDLLPTWRPWPKETLTLTIGRPAGIGGRTLTIDKSTLTVRPGRRASETSLALTIRSSRGGQHVIMLPEGARLQKVQVDSRTLPTRQDGRRVTVPVAPGSQRITLSWRQADGVHLRHHVPAVNLGLDSVNTTITMRLPPNRWVLLTGGALVGPAVLFWSLIGVLIALALVLSRIRWTPLRAVHWLLLFVGLSQVPIWGAAIVAGWLIAVGWRKQTPRWYGNVGFDLRQVALGLWALPAAIVLFAAIHRGLLGRPEMQIAGNGSYASKLNWFFDRAGAELPQPWVLSVPLWIYRVIMLLWALWLAWVMIGWLRWAWLAYREGGLWKRETVVVNPPSPTSK